MNQWMATLINKAERKYGSQRDRDRDEEQRVKNQLESFNRYWKAVCAGLKQGVTDFNDNFGRQVIRTAIQDKKASVTSKMSSKESERSVTLSRSDEGLTIAWMAEGTDAAELGMAGETFGFRVDSDRSLVCVTGETVLTADDLVRRVFETVVPIRD